MPNSKHPKKMTQVYSMIASGGWPRPTESRPRPRTTFKAKDLDPKAKDLSHKAKDLDFGLKDQGQGLTSLLTLTLTLVR